MFLVVQNRGVGTDANIEVAKLCRLSEKLDVPAVQQVVTTTDKYFLAHRSIVSDP